MMKRDSALLRALPMALVLAGMLLNFVMCFLRTGGLSVSTIQIAGVELVILAGVGLLGWRGITGTQLGASLALIIYLVAMRVFNPDLDLKVARDLGIPFLFWTMGMVRGTPEDGDRLVTIVIPLVLGIGLFELLALDTYQNYFDILSYYIDKGAVEPQAEAWASTRLFASGLRPEGDGRTLFPFLGEHRVSSIFLEPVSAGNFGAICYLWLLHRWKHRPKPVTVLCMAGVFACVILADARFGATVSALATIAYVVPWTRRSTLCVALPFLVVSFLMVKGMLNPNGIIDNGFGGRLLGSGILLDSWGLEQWFAFAASPIRTDDSGYGYLLSNVGVLPAIGLWCMLVLKRGQSDEAAAFRNSVAIYAALSLSISGSMFTIKTAALVWFLYGTLCAARPAAVAAAPEEAPDMANANPTRAPLSWGGPMRPRLGAGA